MSKFRSKKSIVLAAVIALVAAASAYAYWSTSGSGSGAATTAEGTTVNVSAITGHAGLFPGGEKSVSFTITNPSSAQSPYVKGADLSISSVKKGDADATGCDANDFVVTDPAAINETIAPSGTKSVTDGKVAMKTTAGDGCQGVTVNLAVAIS